jgi:hypothetical protein
VTKQVVLAGGPGVGMDFLDVGTGTRQTSQWGALRVSPTLRFGRFDAGVHAMFVFTSDRVVTLFEAGVDGFIW